MSKGSCMLIPVAAAAELLPFAGAFTPAELVQIVCWSHLAANAYCGSFTISAKKAWHPATRISGFCKRETKSVSHAMTFSQPPAAVAATSFADFELDLTKSKIFLDTRWKEFIWHESLEAFAIMYLVPVSQSEGFFVGSQSHVPAYMHEGLHAGCCKSAEAFKLSPMPKQQW
jgi:hypothetical protein